MGQVDNVDIIMFLECLLNNALFFCYTNKQDRTSSSYMNMDFTSCWRSKYKPEIRKWKMFQACENKCDLACSTGFLHNFYPFF